MQCPNCNAETTEMLTSCEWCGAPLVGGAYPPGAAH
jgi:ribosomal protein L37AE/L43A